MNPVLLYLLKAMAIAGVGTGYYFLALRNRTHHHWNRYYLLGIVALSLLLPGLRFEWWTPAEEDPSAVVRLLRTVQGEGESEVVVATSGFSIRPQTVALVLWTAVSLFFLLRIGVGARSVRRLMRRTPHVYREGIRFFLTPDERAPFSWFRNLFWHPRIDPESAAGQQILRHEMVHVREGHSSDKLAMQALTALFFFNPFYWIIARELRSIHEFIADRRSVATGDLEGFAQMLLTAAYPAHTSSLINSFFYPSLKRRIAMLQKFSASPRVSYLSRLICLPLIVLIAAAFTINPVWKSGSSVVLEKTYTVVIDAGHGKKANGSWDGALSADRKVSEDEVSLAIAKWIEAENTNLNIRIVLSRPDENFIGLHERTDAITAVGADALVSIHVNTQANSTSNRGFEIFVPKARDGASMLLGSAVQGVLGEKMRLRDSLFTRSHGIWMLEHSPVPARILVECGYLSNPFDLAFITDRDNQKKVAQSILRGIEAYLKAKESGAVLIPATKVDTLVWYRVNNPQIQSMRIMDGETVEFTYKSGKVVRMAAREAISKDWIRVTYPSTQNSQSARQGFVDTPPAKIDPKEISVINVVDDRIEVVLKSGTRHLLTLKEAQAQGITVKASLEKQNGVRGEDINVQSMQVSMKGVPPPLVVIAGKEYPSSVLGSINPNDIERVEVLKNENAKPWGERGKNGVVRITLKSGAPLPSNKGNAPPKAGAGDSSITFSTGAIKVQALGADSYRVTPTTGTSDYQQTFTKVEINPEFPGGLKGWRKFLQDNLKSVTPVDNGAPAGTYTVKVQMIVNKDGSTEDAKALTNHGYGMEAEAVRAVRTITNWNPAIQNGREVRAYHTVSITYIISNGE